MIIIAKTSTLYLMLGERMVAIDFIKPDFHPLLGMSAIQFACILGLIYYRQAIRRLI